MATGVRTIETQVVAEGEWLSVTQVCRASQIDVAVVIELADLGLVCPRGTAPQDWQVSARELVRLRTAARLIRDLGGNVSGAALAGGPREARGELESACATL